MDAKLITRRHLKPEQRRRIAQRCIKSGLSQSEFARRHRIPLSNLQRWMREHQKSSKEIPAVIFHEVAVAPSLTTSATPTWAIEIIGPDGTTVRCREPWSIEDLARILRGRMC